MERIISTIISVNNEIMIIETIIFEFETCCNHSAFLPEKTLLRLRIVKIRLKKKTRKLLKIKNNVQICIQLFCNFYKALNA